MTWEQFEDMLNCASMVTSFFVIIFLVVYLVRETKKRSGTWVEIWHHLPPSMGLATATLTLLTGVFLKTRFLDNYVIFNQEARMVVGTGLITVGGLCVVRSATRSAYGNWPWVLTMVATAVVTILVTFASS